MRLFATVTGWRTWDGVAALLVLAALAGVVWWPRGGDALSGRVRIVDGDTLALEGRRVRLAGLDAPELSQRCGTAAAPTACGERARDALRELVSGHPVECRLGGRDRWGRDLGTCFVAGQDLGAALVRAGWALAYGGYRWEEVQARLAGAGLWAGPFERPSEWRKRHGRAPAHSAEP